MRIYHPHLISCLDDNRLAAYHHDIHILWKAIARPSHPLFPTAEAQVWYGRQADVTWLHSRVRAEVLARGHDCDTWPSAAPEPREIDLHQFAGIPQIGYLENTVVWYRRNLVQLYMAWEREGRYNVKGYEMWRGFPYLGRQHNCRFEHPTRKFGVAELQPLHQTKLHQVFIEDGPAWPLTAHQREGLARLVAIRRKQLTASN